MANVVGDIAISVGADVSPLQRDMKKAGDSIDDFGARSKRMAKTVAKAGAAAAAAIGAIGFASFKVVQSAAAAAAEIERLSRVAGAAPERFQRMAYAAQTVGIEQGKLADILKDVQDRVGDFLQTGGGPMADFFENIAPKVGVTAEQFKNLSGPDALQLFVSSLERAGLSQNEMTFFLEAMSSDLTSLLPLLRNSGAELQRLGDSAQDAGLILSNDAVKGASDLERQMEDLGDALKIRLYTVILENKDTIKGLIDGLAQLIDNALAFAEALGRVAQFAGDAYEAVGDFFSLQRESSSGGRNDARGGKQGNNTINNGPGQMRKSGLLITPNPSGDNTSSGVEPASADYYARILEAEARFQEALAEMRRTARRKELEDTQEHFKNLFSVEEQSHRTKLGWTANAFGDLASLMRTNNEKLFKIGQAAAVAEATVEGYLAATLAWRQGMRIGFPVAVAYAAASLARTGALIAGIASQSPSGGSATSGVATAGGIGATGEAGTGPQTVTVEGVNPGDIFTGQQLIDLFDRLQNEAGDRGLITVFR